MARYASGEHEGLDYLQLRKRLKEEIRNHMKKESGTATGSRNIKSSSSSKDNFGCFFGPSQPVIVQRVIRESKALLENPDLVAKVLRASNPNAKIVGLNPVRPKANTSSRAHIVSGVAKSKIQEIRNARDYSFLLSDDDAIPLPAAPKPVFSNQISAPRPESRSAQLKPKAGLPKSVGVSKQKLPSKASTSVVKRPLPNLPRSNPLKQQHTANSKQALVQNKASQESSKSMIQKPSIEASSRSPPVAMQKHGVPSSRPHVVMQKRMVPPSKPLMKQPVIRHPDRLPAKRPMRIDDEYDDGYSKSREHSPAKRPEDDDATNAIMQIRNLFGYNPNKYVDDDDGGGGNMLATFEDIEKEEWHSVKDCQEGG